MVSPQGSEVVRYSLNTQLFPISGLSASHPPGVWWYLISKIARGPSLLVNFSYRSLSIRSSGPQSVSQTLDEWMTWYLYGPLRVRSCAAAVWQSSSLSVCCDLFLCSSSSSARFSFRHKLGAAAVYLWYLREGRRKRGRERLEGW